MKRNTTFILFAFLAISLPAQTLWYVNKAASGAGNGQNWANAFPDLHSGLAAAQSGDAVWVAEGEYRTDTAGNRNRAFVLKSGVKLYGGFAGTETNPAQRNIPAHLVTLSGNIGNPADSTDNAYTILYMDHPDSSTRVDGFILRHGYASSDTNFVLNSPVQSGGAVYILAQNGKALPVFVNCTFRDNYAKGYGGALFVNGQNTQGSTPVFRNCVFLNNKAKRNGGAICLTGGNAYDRGIEYDHCRFEKNTSQMQGGAIYTDNSFGNEKINFQGCVMTKNYAKVLGGFMSMWKYGPNTFDMLIDSCEISLNKCDNGPAIISLEDNGSLYSAIFSITNSSIFENQVSISSTNSALLNIGSFFTSDINLINNKIYKNTSGGIQFSANEGQIRIEKNMIWGQGPYPNTNDGVGILRISGKKVNITQNVFYNNLGQSIWGYFEAGTDSKYLIENNLFYRNRLNTSVSGNPTSPFIDILEIDSSGYADSIQVHNNLFFENTCGTGYIASPNQTFYNLYNNIFIGNKDANTGAPIIPLKLAYDPFYFSHNLMDVPCSTYANAICGPGNILASDALFADTAASDFRLLPCSPGINAGDNVVLQAFGVTKDIEGNLRILDGIADIGPYESPSLMSMQAPVITAACAGLPLGAIQFDIDQSCPPYTYAWQKGNIAGTSNSNLSPGVYAFSITDSKGKLFAATVTVPTSDPQVSLGGDTITCFGVPVGALFASTTDGIEPITYHWSNGQNGNMLDNLPAGDFTVTATDAIGCRDTASIAINATIPLVATDFIQDASTATTANGAITIEIESGAAPFHYLWNTGDTSASISGLLPGTYMLTISDGSDCTYTYMFTVHAASATGEAVLAPASVFPNPAVESVSVLFGDYEQWNLYSPDGQMVLLRTRPAGGKLFVGLEKLASGVYFYAFQGRGSINLQGKLSVVH